MARNWAIGSTCNRRPQEDTQELLTQWKVWVNVKITWAMFNKLIWFMLRAISDPWHYCWCGKIAFMTTDRCIFLPVEFFLVWGCPWPSLWCQCTIKNSQLQEQAMWKQRKEKSSLHRWLAVFHISQVSQEWTNMSTCIWHRN